MAEPTLPEIVEEGWQMYLASGYATDNPRDAFRAACYHMIAVLDTEEEPDV